MKRLISVLLANTSNRLFIFILERILCIFEYEYYLFFFRDWNKEHKILNLPMKKLKVKFPVYSNNWLRELDFNSFSIYLGKGKNYQS